MKKTLSVILGFCIAFFACGCNNNKSRDANSDSENVQNLQSEENVDLQQYTEGNFVLKDASYEDVDGKKVNEKTSQMIKNAKDILSLAGYECSFESVQIDSQNDEWNFRELYTVTSEQEGKKFGVSFRKDNLNLVKIDSGSIVSDGKEKLYTADKTDDVINLAKKYYAALPVEQGYELSGYQMDFGGPDWQVDFTKKMDVKNYEKAVYNYSQDVRMRISGSDGKLLSLTVFDTPVRTEESDKEQITYEKAVDAAGLDVSKLKDAYIGCYTIRDKGYARLCWCLVYDYSTEYGVCDERSVYVDLYTGLQIGLETCK